MSAAALTAARAPQPLASALNQLPSCTTTSPTFWLHLQAVCAFQTLALLIASFASPWLYFNIRVTASVNGSAYSLLQEFRLYLNSYTVSVMGVTTEQFSVSVSAGFQTLGRASLSFLVLGALAAGLVLLCSLVRALSVAYARPASAWALPGASALAWLQGVDNYALCAVSWGAAVCSILGLALGCSFVEPGNLGNLGPASASADYTGRTLAVFGMLASLLLAPLATRAYMLTLGGAPNAQPGMVPLKAQVNPLSTVLVQPEPAPQQQPQQPQQQAQQQQQQLPGTVVDEPGGAGK